MTTSVLLRILQTSPSSLTSKLEKAIEAQQQELMRCLGMLRGSVGNEGNATDFVDDSDCSQGQQDQSFLIAS